jgi:hypothetical protein
MNANEHFTSYNGTENYYKYHFGLLITDGVKALVTHFGLYWLLDIIASYNPELYQQEFQVWTLIRQEGSTEATVVCTDGNDRILAKQFIPYTDFEATRAEIWLEFGVILLPSEH